MLDDGAVTLFSLDGAPGNEELTEDAVSKLWDLLGAGDGDRAYAAVGMLSVKEGIAPRIAKRLHPIPAEKPEQTARLIADLDADDFDRREAASKRLAALGKQAEPALRKALDETKSAEVRARVAPLLKALDEWAVTDPELLRALRGIWVLERIGTPEARAVLDELAKGAPEARQTQEARNALDFLDRRAATVKP